MSRTGHEALLGAVAVARGDCRREFTYTVGHHQFESPNDSWISFSSAEFQTGETDGFTRVLRINSLRQIDGTRRRSAMTDQKRKGIVTLSANERIAAWSCTGT